MNGVKTMNVLSLLGLLVVPFLANAARAQTPEVRGGAARPELPRFSVSAFSNTGFQRGNGFSLFADSPDLAGAGLAAEVRLLRRSGLSLSARVEMAHEDSRGGWTLGATRYENTSWAAGAVVDVAVLRILRPYAQLTGGLSVSDVRLEGVGAGLSASDRVPFATAALGLRVISHARAWWMEGPALAFSGFVEGGYTLAGAQRYDLQVQGVRPVDAIPLQDVPLGEIARGRAQLRVGVAVHF